MKDNKGTSPIKWKSEMSEQTEQGPQNEAQYLPTNSGISKMYLQNILEEGRLDRNMRRDSHKSFLRREEQREKLILKESHMEIVEKEGAMYALMLDGAGKGISFRKVFSAKMQSLECFRYQRSTKIRWQITLLEERTGIEIISPLYIEEDMKVMSRLKRTILAAYDCSDSAKSRALLWEWIHKEMVSMLKDVDVVEIPSCPGWYADEVSCHFYTMTDEDTSKFSAYMKRFFMPRFVELDMNDTLCSLMDSIEQLGDLSIVGVLLLSRFSALFGRLTGKNCFRTGMVIWGERAEEIARCFLRTMTNDVDTVNLDSDRLGRIREKVRELQDTPVIFLVTNPDSRSVQNRLREVMSWMQTSCIEGEKVKAPFIFCFKRFSSMIPLENMLVLDADSIKLPQDGQDLERFQCLVVEKVEQSGWQWIDEISHRYKKYHESGIEEMGSMARVIREVLLKMFDDINVSRELFLRFHDLLVEGEKEMVEQLSKKTGRLSEMFRDQVSKLVDLGSVEIFNRDRAPVQNECNYIYFDTKYYYFTKEVMGIIGALSGMDRKSVLRVKQEIFNLSMVKTYKATGYRPEEMSKDFRICNAYGQRKDMSGLAVRREFFDEAGGIALCERG